VTHLFGTNLDCHFYFANFVDKSVTHYPAFRGEDAKKLVTTLFCSTATAYNLLLRLHEREAQVLRFMQDLRVPFTNNLAERAMRMPKVKQKISGCFRTLAGAQNLCLIRSYLDTARKQGVGMLAALQSAFRGLPMAFA